MGAVCCVASKDTDKTRQSGSANEILHRNNRYSPTWSFRWDHRRRVAGEDASINWLSDGVSQNDGSEDKNDSAYKSDDGLSLQTCEGHRGQKSPISEGTAEHARTFTSDQPNSRSVSMDGSMEQVKGSVESPMGSSTSPSKPQFSMPSTSFLASPLSFQSHLSPASPALLRQRCHSPGNQILRQVSPGQIPGFKSPSSLPASEERSAFPSWSNESRRCSQGGSSDGWSIPGFSEPMGTSHGGRWSFDSESFGFDDEKFARTSSQISASLTDVHTCCVCSKLLTERSSWSAQKIIASNELSVVAVLVCGHVYHAECLESLTPEINKYDPTCPVCTWGEKQTFKLSEKALKARMEFKARNKRSMNRVVDSGTDDDSIVFDHFKGGGNQHKVSRMRLNSSGRNSSGKPFLRHFSFGSKSRKDSSDNPLTRKKGFFWSKSSK
ncbi:uncharacterized protein LOC114743456 [Neltuma alba]|uniref:uncharacterized protein LOC114743456 n=1 Tax=Neltuma alba TaxID=207710 RepID=UPI0010A40005|nr:uncharacterized protein LOC114725567 isoform X2 [Prosopis alba]XP_028787498.1 uncharacterized protein LOC114743456 [Prosopis alba]XP_028787499.1 uncharacterized protein LOC114743456 [Prosopis alba]XP_028787500.1 uncharacterized protein LOC114743456 [Prosopis alba]XP_028787501.1 uncharacterized protein LOC114743456 [Prosopis alba]XP_028787502.1 uncharacterized protein LOC114743456 [Prosopis alba]